VVGLGGLVLAGLGALLLGSAWDGYVAANPGYRGDVANPPPASTAIGTQALLALAMLAFGYLVALIASLLRLRRTRGGWMLLRALAALSPIPILWLWLRHFFTFLVSNICSDCSPPQPLIPDVFQFGNNVLVGAAVLGLILSLVFFAFAIFSFVRTGRRPQEQHRFV
jgi:predicted permease